jgi:uncharacterized membrane protein YesL
MYEHALIRALINILQTLVHLIWLVFYALIFLTVSFVYLYIRIPSELLAVMVDVKQKNSEVQY